MKHAVAGAAVDHDYLLGSLVRLREANVATSEVRASGGNSGLETKEDSNLMVVAYVTSFKRQAWSTRVQTH